MQVMTRKYQEKIRIGENITVTVLKKKGQSIRLGVEAPFNVSVVRGELKETYVKTPKVIEGVDSKNRGKYETFQELLASKEYHTAETVLRSSQFSLKRFYPTQNELERLANGLSKNLNEIKQTY